jgi:AcrR family transcriptional regulator
MAIEPRKRPAQSRSQATVDAIVEGAARILEERGFEGYNTNAIAETAGVSVGSIYQYFPDKDAITAALIRREAGLLLIDAATARQAKGAHEGLIHLIDAAIRHQLRRPVLARLIDIEEGRLPLSSDNQGVEANLMADLIAILMRPGLGRVPDPRMAALDIVAIVRGMIDAAGQRGEGDPPALAHRVRAAVFGYLDRIGRPR